MGTETRISLMAPLEKRLRLWGLIAVALTILMIGGVSTAARLVVTVAAAAEPGWNPNRFAMVGPNSADRAIFLVTHPWLAYLLSVLCCLGSYETTRFLLRHWPGTEKAFVALLLAGAVLSAMLMWNAVRAQNSGTGTTLSQRIKAMQPQTHLTP